jgi:hypothetical protein
MMMDYLSRLESQDGIWMKTWQEPHEVMRQCLKMKITELGSSQKLSCKPVYLVSPTLRIIELSLKNVYQLSAKGSDRRPMPAI